MDDFHYDTLQEILAADADDIADVYGTVKMLRHEVSPDGICTAVFDVRDEDDEIGPDVAGERHYRAMEYTSDEDGSWCQAHGYDTTERHWYMGQRYRGLWGEYEGEVYGN